MLNWVEHETSYRARESCISCRIKIPQVVVCTVDTICRDIRGINLTENKIVNRLWRVVWLKVTGDTQYIPTKHILVQINNNEFYILLII